MGSSFRARGKQCDGTQNLTPIIGAQAYGSCLCLSVHRRIGFRAVLGDSCRRDPGKMSVPQNAEERGQSARTCAGQFAARYVIFKPPVVLRLRSLRAPAVRAAKKPVSFFRRGVAQPGRAPGSGPGGRWFKSTRPDHSKPSSLCQLRSHLSFLGPIFYGHYGHLSPGDGVTH